GRANRPVPPQPGGFGPPGSGDAAGQASEGAYDDYDDYVKPSAGRRWLKRSLITLVVLGIIGGGLYGGYRWTQTQYYVGAKDQHLAVYQGINQDLAWFKMNKVYEDHPEIELKYLPVDQRSRVQDTITLADRDQAVQKAKDLGTLAGTCKKLDERKKAEAEAKKQKEKADKEKAEKEKAGGTGGTKPLHGTNQSSTHLNSTPTPNPGPTLSEEEQKLVPQCSSSQ
ncbi:protein phosphatase, partial [Streptomyces sp. NPDC057654]